MKIPQGKRIVLIHERIVQTSGPYFTAILFFLTENTQKVIHDSFVTSSMFSLQIPSQALELMLPFYYSHIL